MDNANIDTYSKEALDRVRSFDLPRKPRSAGSLLSPDPDSKDGKTILRQWATKYPRKSISGVTEDVGDQTAPGKQDDMHLTIGGRFSHLSEHGKIDWLGGFRNLTSITSPSLLPWHVMCLSNMRTCTIGVEVKRCARFDFTVPESAKIPQADTARLCHIRTLVAQVPIEFLDNGIPDDRIFGYLPALVHLAPDLKHLALQLTRKEGMGRCPGNEVERSYNTLVRHIHSTSLESLLIDTCDIESSAVRQCPEDFFEIIRPITSLNGIPNLRRIVAPQEAFVWVNGRLDSFPKVNFVSPTILLPDSIQRIEIIDSTTALNKWVEGVLDVWQANSGVKVSTLSGLKTITLWCDRWYPTLVPDFRSDELYSASKDHYPVPGRGGRENALLTTGKYGEYPGFIPYKPEKADKMATTAMRTGVKMVVDMSLAIVEQYSVANIEKNDKGYGTPRTRRADIWSMMKKADIKVEHKPDETRGWRQERLTGSATLTGSCASK
jgi:hypothetical protein